MDIDLKEEIRKQDELLAEYLRVIEIQKGLIQEQKKMIEYLEDHISKITDIISDICPEHFWRNIHAGYL